jgi:transposase
MNAQETTKPSIMDIVNEIHELTDKMTSVLQPILRNGEPKEEETAGDICDLRLILEALRRKHYAILERINL